MAKSFPLPSDAPDNLDHYIDQFHFVEEETYKIGITNVDKDLLDWKYEPQQICVQCIECYTVNTAQEVYNHLIKKGHTGIGEDLKGSSGVAALTKVFSLVEAIRSDL